MNIELIAFTAYVFFASLASYTMVIFSRGDWGIDLIMSRSLAASSLSILQKILSVSLVVWFFMHFTWWMALSLFCAVLLFPYICVIAKRTGGMTLLYKMIPILNIACIFLAIYLWVV